MRDSLGSREMGKSLRISRLLPLSITLAATCSDAQGPALPTCPARVTVAVSSGVSPSFSWMPSCRLHGLAVVRVDIVGPFAWSIRPARGMFELNPLAPPVQYGITPTGMEADGPATSLTPGGRYWVAVSRADSGAIGGAYFVP